MKNLFWQKDYNPLKRNKHIGSLICDCIPHASCERIDSYLHQVGFHSTIANCKVYVQR